MKSASSAPFSQVKIGLSVTTHVKDLRDLVNRALEMGFQFISTHITFEDYVRKALLDTNYEQVTEPFGFDDTLFKASDWSKYIVGQISNLEPMIIANKNNITLLNRIRQILMDEISYCEHIALQDVVFEVNNHRCEDLAELIGAKISETTRSCRYPMNYWIKLPVGPNDDSTEPHPWSIWYKFKTLSGAEAARSLCLALELGSNAPSPDEFERWLGEPVKAVYISTSVFITNHKGFPVLSKLHQDLIRKCFRLRIQIILSTNNITSFHKYYFQYIQHLRHTADQGRTELYDIHPAYENVLQVPLQPLHDNLESHIYQTFERDPVKYELYETAIYQALVDRTQNSSGESESQNPMILMVVGAGRGPLVQKCLIAADKANVKVHVYAVEKNRNAANNLHYLIKQPIFEGRTTVVHQDMRKFNPEHKADIIVSELLGSFGDNELAPECLDGAERFLKDDGIMIPQTYSSYIGPIGSAVLHREVAQLNLLPEKYLSAFDTPYVVSMRSKSDIDYPQKLFTFNSPNKGYSENETGIGDFKNERCAELTFTVKQDNVLHGFAGYFECILYREVIMSIYPPTFSKHMFSWFPIYFPIQEPMEVKTNEKITLHFWRKLEPHKRHVVWYEWAVSSPKTSKVHNTSGSVYSMNFG